MGSFITSIGKEVIRDEEAWFAWESVDIREYTQGQKEAMERETMEMAGLPGKIPNVIMWGDLVPVLVAGIESWTFRDLSDDEVVHLYENQAKKLDKDVDSLSASEKCEAVKDIEIVLATREWMSKLKPSYATFIARAIRKLNRGRTTAEERAFLRKVGADYLIEKEPASGDSTD